MKRSEHRILHARGEDFDDPEQQWDCIVFNEVLYYTSNPCIVLGKYGRLVRAGGIIIVSIYQKPGSSIRARLLHLLDRHKPISNLHCARTVHNFMVRSGWLMEEDTSVAVPGTVEHWRIWVARPR
jgi:2-polyprenyl-3-methyl-5-hydroxy-6-metoxy-1,4-benzoquinol methylase